MSEESLRLLLLGKTGSGKSSTGNTILAEKLFQELTSPSSSPEDCERKVSKNRGKTIEVTDSPGLYDTSKSEEETFINIVQAVAAMHPGPHAILYVIPVGRYTGEDYKVFDRIKTLFDESICKYMILVFTGGDRLESEGKTLQDFLAGKLPKNFEQVLNECNNRCILFNNKAENEARDLQVDKLFDMVRKTVDEQGGQPYTCPKYYQIGQGIEKEVTRRIQEVEERELKEKHFVQQLKQEKEQAVKIKDELQKKAQDLEKQKSEKAIENQKLFEKLQADIRQRDETAEKLHQEYEKQKTIINEKDRMMTEIDKQRADEYAEKSAQQKRDNEAMMKQMKDEHEKQIKLINEEGQKIIREMEEQRQRERKQMEDDEKKKLEQREKETEFIKRQMMERSQAHTFWNVLSGTLNLATAIVNRKKTVVLVTESSVDGKKEDTKKLKQ